MPFAQPLTPTQHTNVRSAGVHHDQYLLVCPETQVFRAPITQTTFEDEFATIEIGTAEVGTIADALEGFTVYVSATTAIADAYWTGYVRSSSSGSILNINQTSAALTTGDYVIVTKDVRAWAKLIRYDGSTFYRNYNVTFRRLLPVISGLQTAYVGVLAGGVATFAFSPTATATDADATTAFIWTWKVDGGTITVGSTNSREVEVVYDTAGHHMPRVTVTDSNGNSLWFSFHVFVVPADYSSVARIEFDGASIAADAETGWTATLTSDIGDITDIPDGAFVAVWQPSNGEQIVGDIAFAGRLRSESVAYTYDPQSGEIASTSFEAWGVASQMEALMALRLAAYDESSPAAWQDIESLTPWRFVIFFLTEHTTIANTHSIGIDDATATYRCQSQETGDATTLPSLRQILQGVRAGLEFAQAGEIRVSPINWLQSDTTRDAQDTIADLTLADIEVDSQGGALYSVERQYGTVVGRVIAGGAVFNTSTGSIQVFKAFTPATVYSESGEVQTLNGQILTADATNTEAYTELGQIAADYYAAAQPVTLLTVNLPAVYDFIQPSRSRWVTFDLPANGHRGRAYTTADRWTCESVSISQNMETGRRTLQATFRLETQGGGYQGLVIVPPDETGYSQDVMPVAPTYPNLPELPDISQPDPANPSPAGLPPFTPEDVAVAQETVPPGEAIQQAQRGGGYGVVWSADAIWLARYINSTDQPTYTDITPAGLSKSISHVQIDPFGSGGWLLAADANSADLYRSRGLGSLAWVKTESQANYKMVRAAGIEDTLYAYTPRGQTGQIGNYDFNISLNDFSLIRGTWEAYDGGVRQVTWSQDVFEGGTGVIIQKDFASPIDQITRVEFSFYIDIGGYAADAGILTRPINLSLGGYANLWNYSRTDTTNLGSGEHTLVWTGLATNVTNIYARVLSHTYDFGISPKNRTAIIRSITFEGTIGDASFSYSTDFGAGLGGRQLIGLEIAQDYAGFDTSGSKIYAGYSETVATASAGGTPSDLAGTDLAGSYPKAIWAYDDDKLLLASADFVSSESLWKVESGSKTDITPDDSGTKGIVVGPDGLAAFGSSTIICLMSFGGTVKLAYSADGGSNWQINAQVSNAAIYCRIYRLGSLYTIYVADGNTLWYGTWDGSSTLTLQAKTSPAAALLGVEIR